MIEIGIHHNGAVDLPVGHTPQGRTVCTGTIAEISEAYRRVTVDQVRQGVLADKLGFEMYSLTEHHFQPEGNEFSTNPLMTCAAIAGMTKRIKLGQAANILTWHHPVRIAEQAAMVDILSGGRLAFGVGRGYQARETEVLGGQMGATVQDQERNRVFFEECIDIILKCWTEPSFSHYGEFFQLPPRYTNWHIPSTIDYFSQEHVERSVDQVINLQPVDSSGKASSTLREISVFPQPVQKPHPQMFMPTTSTRSIQFAASRGLNTYGIGNPAGTLKYLADTYYAEAEKAGWPDKAGLGQWKYGWDSQRQRGNMLGRFMHITNHGVGDLERATLGLQAGWDYYGSFGFGGFLSEPGEKSDPNHRVTAQEAFAKKVALFGSTQYIIDEIISLKDYLGFEDMLIALQFEVMGLPGEMVEDQMICFAEEVLPVVRRECGGAPDLPSSTVEIDPPVERSVETQRAVAG